uniref:Uncharacterized protein n=1 Tax=Arundo donax TaxID=35708 RepID=A0A0A9CBU1_ARUDO
MKPFLSLSPIRK